MASRGGSLPAARVALRAAVFAFCPAAKVGKIEHHPRQTGVNIASAKPRAEPGQDPVEIRGRCAAWRGVGQWCLPAPRFAGAEIGSHQDMHRRMLGPIRGELFDVEERHFVDYGIAVAAGGGEEAINLAPAVAVSWLGSDTGPATVDPAPEPAPGAAASPRRLSRSFRPEPVRTALSTAPALPRSSRFSTISAVASG